MKDLSIVAIGLTISTILFLVLSPVIILLILLRLCNILPYLPNKIFRFSLPSKGFISARILQNQDICQIACLYISNNLPDVTRKMFA